MRAILFSVLLLSLAPLAVGQPNPDSIAQSRTIYVLIDVSGSMESRLEDAEAELAIRLKSIVEANPETMISRTEFRAENEQACRSEIQIAEPKPVGEQPERASKRRFANDLTPLGAALFAAIKHAGDGPADIYLVSDWAQSPNCGIDVGDALQALKPTSDVAIIPIAVRPNDSDLETARELQRSSIVAIGKEQKLVAPEADRDLAIGSVDDPSSKVTPSKAVWVKFLEMWTWLIGFSALAGSAVWFGLRDSSWSVEIEGRTEDARSLRRQMQDGVPQAEIQLTSLIKDKKENDRIFRDAGLFWRDRKVRSAGDQRDDEKASHLIAKPLFWTGVLGGALLLSLALLDERIRISSYSLAAAKDYAKAILNSNFATAFAGTWIVLLYFASKQGQRRREADRNFNIATDEARRVAELERAEAHKSAYKDYSAQLARVRAFEFLIPWHEVDGNDEDETLFNNVMREAIQLALRSELDASHPKEILEKEARRLQALPQPRRIEWGIKRQFGQFLTQIVGDGSVESLADEWQTLAHIVVTGTSIEIVQAFRLFLKPGNESAV